MSAKSLVAWFILITFVGEVHVVNAKEILYSCTFNYFPLSLTDVRLSIHYLHPKNRSSGKAIYRGDAFELRELRPQASIKDLEASGLDPELPIMFFTNGFNQSKYI